MNYTVTSNHINLLIFDEKGGNNIAAIKLAAGRTAQANNNRNNRKGAFWDGRYHTTAVSKNEHLMNYMVHASFTPLNQCSKTEKD